MCSDVTMGIHGLETILMLYRGLFVQVILNNAQAWSNLTQTDLKALQTIQLKYIKRAFHAPSSTSNTLTYLETGILQRLTHRMRVKFVFSPVPPSMGFLTFYLHKLLVFTLKLTSRGLIS